MAKRKLPQSDRAVIIDHLRRFTPTDWVALLLVVIVIVTTVSQLMTFDKFTPIIRSYYLPFYNTAPVISAFIVTAEVFCLPYLLGISLSRPARLISASLGVITGLIWAILGIWILSGPNNLTTSGIFGSLLKVVPGPWMIVYGFGFSALYLMIVGAREKATIKRLVPSRKK